MRRLVTIYTTTGKVSLPLSISFELSSLSVGLEWWSRHCETQTNVYPVDHANVTQDYRWSLAAGHCKRFVEIQCNAPMPVVPLVL